MMKPQRRITKAYFEKACIQYIPLIHQLALRIGIDARHVEELKAQANEELLKCMVCYRRSGLFITFFHGRLSHIFMHMRDAENRFRRTKIMPLETMSRISGPNIDIDTHMIIEELMMCLDDEERSVITGLFFDHKTMRELSKEKGTVPSIIWGIKGSAICKMRQKSEIGQE